MVNFYVLLELTEDASEEAIRKAYRRLAKQYHPDVNKAPEAQAKFILIHKAYEVLIDYEARKKYDREAGVRSDPYYDYNRWLAEKKAFLEAEELRKKVLFDERREAIQNSKWYYPFLFILYFSTFFLVSFSVLIFIGCAFTIFKFHVLMFLVMMPFICLGAWLLKLTLDEYKKYKALFY